MLIVERPIITEKTLAQAQKGTYTFAVAPDKSKPAIARAVEQLYGVTVSKVRVQSVKGRFASWRTRGRVTRGQQRDWKKALVTLKAGQKISDFEFPEKKDEAKKTESKTESKTEPSKEETK